MSTRRWIQSDLAPGDARASRLDVSGLALRAVASVDDPAFAPAYGFLAETFGPSGALERVDVLAQRFAWPRHAHADGWTLQYELLSISDADGNIAAVRDHTAAVPPGDAEQTPQVIVHLSHVLVAKRWRRSGLGGWLRALPVQVARDCLRLSGRETDAAAMTLVAEMEEAAPGADERPASLLAYEKAGFRKLDPAQISYVQPDFRAPEEIDRGGGPRPLPFSLVLRQVGREDENEVSGAQARALARALYRIYRDGCRASDLAPLLARVEGDYPPPGKRVRLVPPTAA
jgi:GNAT superfamily N-acetyltransferase